MDPTPPYQPPKLSHPSDGAYPVPLSGSPLAAQPRAVGALAAFDEGLNLIVARPALYGLLPVAVLFVRSLIALLMLAAATAYGLDWWSWTTLGHSPFQLPESAWKLLALAVAGLMVAEHAAIHCLLVCLPRSLRNEPWTVGDVFSPKAFGVTAIVRLITYVALGIGFVMLGVGTALALPLVLAPFYAADERLGVFSAASRSSVAVLRHFGTALLFEFVSLGLLLCGILLCGVGVVPAYVVVTAGRAALYEQLARTTPSTP